MNLPTGAADRSRPEFVAALEPFNICLADQLATQLPSSPIENWHWMQIAYAAPYIAVRNIYRSVEDCHPGAWVELFTWVDECASSSRGEHGQPTGVLGVQSLTDVNLGPPCCLVQSCLWCWRLIKW
ncbi:hypothetical protein BMS3Bbin04_01793 [bacterium BMS3Bbin04]|nr:hypothetical protein BMS3Bbin04_01793 [bacterium BMS3Bbin04]